MEQVIYKQKPKMGRPVGSGLKWDEKNLCDIAEKLIDWLSDDDSNIFYKEWG